MTVKADDKVKCKPSRAIWEKLFLLWRELYNYFKNKKRYMMYAISFHMVKIHTCIHTHTHTHTHIYKEIYTESIAQWWANGAKCEQ
jgi:hypothetical protein